MPEYSCDRCGKDFTQKSHYDSHKMRKKPCENYSDKIQSMVDKKVKETINDLNINNIKKLIFKNSELSDNTYTNMRTFKDLYEFLQNYENDNIIDWLKDSWEGKDKQESLLRLFAGLGLIDKLNNYNICKGNFNTKTITIHTSKKDIFYDETNNLINLKDKGDSSDLTGIHKKNTKHLIVTTSKCLKKEQAGALDIEKVSYYFDDYPDFKISLCICIKNQEEFKIMKNRIEKTNEKLKKHIEQHDTVIIDWNDLNQSYNQFKMSFQSQSLDTIINSNKNTFCSKMHQSLGSSKTIKLKADDKLKPILWGHIQRSGKSYIIGDTIYIDSRNTDNCNYLIITTAINETEAQYHSVFNHLQFEDFNVKTLKKETEKEVKQSIKKHKKNIIIISDMYIKNTTSKNTEYYDDSNTMYKIKKIKWLQDLNFEFIFLDESHKGGTTKMAQEMMLYYGRNATPVYITATYSKPTNDYNIPKDRWILWDLEDVKLCKNIDNGDNLHRLVEKHGNDIKKILEKYSFDNIKIEYSKYPDLWLLTDELSDDTVKKIINRNKITGHEYDGYSLEGCFLLNEQKYISKKENESDFQSPNKVLDIFYRIFGKKTMDEFGDIYDEKYPRDKVFMERIQNICSNPINKSRFIGKDEFQHEPMIIMTFLPQNNIDKISKATISLLEKYNVVPDYELISINSKVTSNPTQTIEDARNKARISGKKGVLVFSGKQCSLGVTINNCDIVLLLNNNMGFDMIYQMMFRCMTEGANKKCGFVIDLNIHRVVETSVINYASLIKPDKHPKEATKFILQERLINLNGDHWMSSFGNDTLKINTLCNNIYEIYSSNTETAIDNLINRLYFKDNILSTDEKKILNTIFSNVIPSKKKKEILDTLLDDTKPNINKGIEITNIDGSSDTPSNTTTEETIVEEINDKQINYMDIMKHIMPLVCILTIHSNETSFLEMFDIIEHNKYIYDILIDQTKSWWGKCIDSVIIKKLINIYVKYMKDNKEINQIVRTVKELLIKNMKNTKELSNLIDKYLIPQELEKKSNAEIPTPYKLRQLMVNKIPLSFWCSIKKVFEPSAGKGGFLIDIIDRFMIGLAELIPNEQIRYKTIVEECLYFSDINSTNIFICKLLIDPHNEYNLNYNEGNTLELDISKTTENWHECNGFDAIIGNPPYQAVSETGTSKGGGNNLYTKFIYYADENLKKDGYLLYINPPTYFGPGRSNNKNDMNLRKDILDKYYFHYINLEECSKYFNVGSKFMYYLIQKNDCINENLQIVCKYNNIIYDTTINQKLLIRNYLPYLLTNDCLNILNLIKNKDVEKLSIFHSPDNRSDKNHVLDKKYTESYEQYKERSHVSGHIYPMQATSVQIVYSSKKCKNQDDKKVLMSRSGYLKPFYDDGVIGIGGDCFACLVNNEIEGQKIIKLLNSKLYNFYIETNKWSGFHNKEVLQDLPNIINELDEINDESIYKYFKITEDDIKLIEKSI